ncbi:MAG: glycosyltransferase [Halieaceae bacterium]|nr:glycosyltransferase [Halieaceae bacterium]
MIHNSALPALRATIECLLRAVERGQRDGVLGDARLTLIDNASSQDYRAGLRALLAEVEARFPAARQELRCSDANPGFGAGHNAAQAGAAEDLLLILNPDVELAEEALLLALKYLAEHPGVVAVNPRSSRPDGSPEHLCKRHPALVDLLLRGGGSAALREYFSARLARYEYRDRDPGVAAVVELLSGACLLCRREAFEACAGFDERFFLYFEDFDLSRRLARYGELHYLPAMRVVHHGGFAASKGWKHRRWFMTSALRFFARHGWKLF